MKVLKSLAINSLNGSYSLEGVSVSD